MKTLCLFFCVVLASVPGVHAQQSKIVCKGIVRDKIKKKPLQNVRIYYCDTIPVYSDRTGKFRITVNTGDKLHFRKAGYAWHTEKITKDEQTVYLSVKDKSSEKSLGIYNNPDSTEMVYDGKHVPFKEWDDAASTHPSEILGLDTYKSKNGQKNRLIFTSIFQWNEEK